MTKKLIYLLFIWEAASFLTVITLAWLMQTWSRFLMHTRRSLLKLQDPWLWSPVGTISFLKGVPAFSIRSHECGWACGKGPPAEAGLLDTPGVSTLLELGITTVHTSCVHGSNPTLSPFLLRVLGSGHWLHRLREHETHTRMRLAEKGDHGSGDVENK